MQVRSDLLHECKRPKDSNARRYRRALYSIPISLQMPIPGGLRMTRGVSLDICEGGIGALVPSELRVGDVVEIELRLPTQELNVMAIVRHSCGSHSGFEFLGLSAAEHQQLAGIVSRINPGSRFGNA